MTASSHAAARAGATKTSTRLPDGRELIYFDERPLIDRSVHNACAVLPPRVSSEIRYDRLMDQWVLVAAHRQARTHLPPDAECPLCPSSPGRTTEIPAADYDVVVFENRFPALAGRSGPEPDGDGAGAFRRRPGIGRCEVICFTAEHEKSFADLDPARVATVVDAWIDRTRALSALPGVEQVFVFENRGREIGVTLSHPHGQIYAYPFVPPRVARTLLSSERHGGCLHCAAVAAELAAGTRVVAETSRWAAFVPHAASWPFEVHVYPRRHVPDLPALDAGERAELPALYLDVLRRFDGVYGMPMPYVAGWQQAPARAGRELGHLLLQVFSIRRAPDKLKYLAGSESAMGVWINDVAPERAAELLRAAG